MKTTGDKKLFEFLANDFAVEDPYAVKMQSTSTITSTSRADGATSGQLSSGMLSGFGGMVGGAKPPSTSQSANGGDEGPMSATAASLLGNTGQSSPSQPSPSSSSATTNSAQLDKNSSTRWRKAALKNAFVLLSKRKFQLSAAFFVLGGEVGDAITVCLKNLEDPQLALVVARLVASTAADKNGGVAGSEISAEESLERFRSICIKYILPWAVESKKHWPAFAILWSTGLYERAIEALVRYPDAEGMLKKEEKRMAQEKKKKETLKKAKPANRFGSRLLQMAMDSDEEEEEPEEEEVELKQGAAVVLQSGTDVSTSIRLCEYLMEKPSLKESKTG